MKGRLGSPRSAKKTPKPKPIGNMVKWEEHVENKYNCRCFKCPGLYANEVKRFVGIRDIKGSEFKGEAHPEPIVPITENNLDNLMRLTGLNESQIGDQFYLGILEFEVELMTLLFTLKNMGHRSIMMLMGRGQGKTYIEDWENSIEMKFWARNILLLSETDAMLKVGNWMYLWALNNNYIKTSQKFAKKDSYQHFTLINGAQLDIYGFMIKKTVGIHDVKIVGDDIVNFDWKNRPADNKRAKEHWNSSLNPIIRTGLEIFGTRKFEDDPLEYLMNNVKGMIVIKVSSFKACPHNPIPNEEGVYDECNICKDDCLVAPEIHSYAEYMDKKEEDYESWYSEYMQNTNRKEGGMLSPEDIHFTSLPHFKENVILGGTGVDCADTLDERNDYVGIVSCLSQRVDLDKVEKGRRRFVFYASDIARRLARNSEVKEKKKPCDWTEIDEDGEVKRIVRGIIESVQVQCEFHRLHYPKIPYIVAWERNRSGIAIMEQALLEYRKKEKVEIEKGKWVRLTWPGHLVPDHKTAAKYKKQGKANVPMGITHGTDKIKRVYGQLLSPD